MTSNPIRQLPVSLVNRIAAGEVIERPASVVKELVENSIDAGASFITIEIEDGGRGLIRIVDDGQGIEPGDLPLALARHATSKLQCDEDLFRIGTMGFRGEALASIGAVANLRLQSRPPEQDIAYEIHNRGGQIGQPQAAAGNRGTTIEVRDLFFNVPARRKFLKGAGTEFGHISETVLRAALGYPGVHFKVINEGKLDLDLPAGDAVQRWLAAWPKEFAERFLPIDVRDVEIRLRGLAGLPELARPTAKYQYLMLNNRPIRDRFVQHALREAYRGLTEPGRQPAAILLLEIPTQDVDVNVHPTKSEVRFRDSGRIHGLVLAGIREKLLGSDLVPVAQPRADWTPAPTPIPGGDMRQKLAEFFRNPEFAASTPQSNIVRDIPPPAPMQPISSAGSVELPPAIQLHNSYLVAQSEDGLIIIDQHALHERIIYEDLLARLSRGSLESQRLLIPLTLEASPRQQEMLEPVQTLLARLGIEVSSVGPGAVAVHAFPSFLHRLDPVEFLRQVLDRCEQDTLEVNQEELLHEILDMMACKAAIKAGDPLSGAEIESLLARRHLIDRSSNCPHGRPTTLRLTLHDLEKQFKRTGF